MHNTASASPSEPVARVHLGKLEERAECFLFELQFLETPVFSAGDYGLAASARAFKCRSREPLSQD